METKFPVKNSKIRIQIIFVILIHSRIRCPRYFTQCIAPGRMISYLLVFIPEFVTEFA